MFFDVDMQTCLLVRFLFEIVSGAICAIPGSFCDFFAIFPPIHCAIFLNFGPSAYLQPLGGWRKCLQRMHDQNGLLDACLASLREPA